MRFKAMLRYLRDWFGFYGTMLQFLFFSRNIILEKGGDVDG